MSDSNRVLAGYYSREPEPQRQTLRFGPDNDLLIEPFFHSATRRQVPVTVLHDAGLSQGFRRRWTTPRFGFHQVEQLPSGQSRDCNHDRFSQYRKYLKARPEIEKVFCVDLFDVSINKNPFPLIESVDVLYAGREPQTIDVTPWVRDQIRVVDPEFEKNLPYLLDRQVYNAGCIGGSRAAMLWFLDRCEYHFTVIRKRNHGFLPYCNMGVFNYILHAETDPGKAQTPEYLTSRFRDYQWGAEVAFVHK